MENLINRNLRKSNNFLLTIENSKIYIYDLLSYKMSLEITNKKLISYLKKCNVKNYKYICEKLTNRIEVDICEFFVNEKIVKKFV